MIVVLVCSLHDIFISRSALKGLFGRLRFKSARYSNPSKPLDRPCVCQKFAAPRFQDNPLTILVLTVSPTYRKHIPFRKYSWYSLLLEAESNLGPKYDVKDYIKNNSNDTIGNRIRDLAPQCLNELRHREPPF
jgi:hypothetical protein